MTDDTMENDVSPTDEEVTKPEEDMVGKLLAQKAGFVSDFTVTLRQLTEKEKFNRADILKGFAKLWNVVNMLDVFCDGIVHDLQVANQRSTSMEENLFKVSQNLTIITTILQDADIVNNEKMLAVWNNRVKPELEQKVKALQDKIETKSSE